jgi:hypothetical protein
MPKHREWYIGENSQILTVSNKKFIYYLKLEFFFNEIIVGIVNPAIDSTFSNIVKKRNFPRH